MPDSEVGPASDAEVSAWVHSLGLPGLVDLHVHFLPERVMHKVWAFFDNAAEHYGTPWPIHYRMPEQERIGALRDLAVQRFAPLVYPHKEGMAAWLNDWAFEFGCSVPEAVPTATLHPEPEIASTVSSAVQAGARCFKAHVQVGAYDPRSAQLDAAWGILAEAGIPVIVHCGHGPIPGAYTGVDVFGEVLQRHPKLVAVLAHAGMPEYEAALRLVHRYPNVYLDTTMVGVPFSEGIAPVPTDWPARLAEVPDRVALGTDFPNIPYSYATQLRAIAGWAYSHQGLGAEFLRSVLHTTPSALLGWAETGSAH